MRSQTRWRFLTSKNTALYPSEAEKAEFKSATYVPAHVLPMSPVCTLKAVLQTADSQSAIHRFVQNYNSIRLPDDCNRDNDRTTYKQKA